MSNQAALKVSKGPSDLLVQLSMCVGSRNFDGYMQAIGLKKCPKAYFLGDNMTYLRKKRGITRDQLAHKISMGVERINRYELEMDIPDVCQALAIAEYFNVSVHDLTHVDLKRKEN